jgi:ABC-type glycerol-3-phosphate transport system substrate-binding protein
MEKDTPYREVPPRPNAIRLELTYDGPEVAAGTMDAYALGSAMQSLAEYIDASASLLYGAGTTVTHEVEAEFKQGSFTLFLTSLTPDQAEAAGNLLQYLTSKEFYEILGLTGGGGLFGLVRFLRGQKPAAVGTIPGTQQATVTNGSGQTTIVNAHTVNLYNNTTVR